MGSVGSHRRHHADDRHLPAKSSTAITPTQALAGTSFGTLFLIFGVIIAGALIDRVGSGIFFMGASIFFGVATFTFYSYAGTSLQTMFVLYGVMGLSVGMAGAVPYVMVRAFPASVRFSGLSFAYNVSYAVFGGLTPIGVTTALAINPMAHAWYLVFIAILAFALGVYLYLRGSEIESHVGIEELAALRS